MEPKKQVWLLMGWLVSLVWVFASGFLTHKLIFENTPTTVYPQPSGTTPNPTFVVKPTLPPAEEPNVPMVPLLYPEQVTDRAYYDDTLTVMTQTEPPLMVVATYTRKQDGSKVIHTGRASYFDGTAWHRNVDSKTSESFVFQPNRVSQALTVYQAQDRVLRQKLEIQLTIDNTPLTITTGILDNELTLRTEPSYMRIISDGTGTLNVAGKDYPVRVMYTKWYSMDHQEMGFYNRSYGITTKVIDFWGDDGSVFHLDATQVANPDTLYASHQLATFTDKDKRLTKTFTVGINNDTGQPPNQWQVAAKEPVGLEFTGTTDNYLTRAEGPEYDWYRGILHGTITLADGTTITGRGTFEFIQEK